MLTVRIPCRFMSMDDEANWLRTRIERYRQLLKTVTDERAVKAIRQLIAETEARLEQIVPCH